ncbi:MAG: KOW domain-containing RNA-binding protein [Oscillospiraceae bacterium]|jgi:hypothetical protein|nr:KOW domain-containing RNA-binding protein [Oscillospiraceae bacterium]
MTTVSKGFAFSNAGHDSGTLYLITGAEKTKLLLVDGKHRKLDKPKLKNIKHLTFLPESVYAKFKARIEREDLTDAEVRRVLAAVKNREEVT